MCDAASASVVLTFPAALDVRNQMSLANLEEAPPRQAVAPSLLLSSRSNRPYKWPVALGFSERAVSPTTESGLH